MKKRHIFVLLSLNKFDICSCYLSRLRYTAVKCALNSALFLLSTNLFCASAAAVVYIALGLWSKLNKLHLKTFNN